MLEQPPKGGSMEGEQSLAEHYRERAAKTRKISKSATDPALVAHLASVAREYDEMADKLEAELSGKPKPD
jgi:hypothetical protein